MRNKRTQLILVVVGAVLIVLFAWMFISRIGTATITIKAISPTPNSDTVAVTVTREDKEEEKFELNAGFSKTVRLKKGLVRVNSRVGNLRSVDIVDVGKTLELTVPTGKQQKIAKLGANALCPLVLPQAVFSYNCFSEGIIVRHLSETSSTAIFGGQVFRHLRPVGNGLIGFDPNNLKELRYFDLLAEKSERVALPQAVQTLLDTSVPVVVSPNTPGSTRFALVFTEQNKAFLFKNISDTSPVEIEHELSFNQLGRKIAPGFSGENFTLFVGILYHIDDDRAEETVGAPTDEELAKLPVHFYEYDENGGLVKTHNLGNGFEATGMYKLADDYYEVENVGQFYVYQYVNNALKPVYQVTGVASWVNVGTTLYMQTEDGTLYKFVPGKDGLFGLHSVFTSDTLKVAQVFNSARGLVFTGYTSSSSGLSDIYQLLDEEAGPNEQLPDAIVSDDLIYVGTEDLITYGVTTEQVEALKLAIEKFTQADGRKSDQIVITDIVPGPYDRFSANSVYTINFKLTWAQETMNAKMEYFDLVQARLYLYKAADNSLIFDSQVVTGQ